MALTVRRELFAALGALALWIACSGGESEPGGAGTGGTAGSGSGGTGSAAAAAGTGGSGASTGGADGGGPSGGSAGAPWLGPTRYPHDAVTSPISEQVASKLRAIAAKSPTRDAKVFAKLGDSHTVSQHLLHCFAGPPESSAQLELDGRDALLPTIEHFRAGDVAGSTPFGRSSLAASVGKSASWAVTGSPSPLDQELEAANPRFALVSFGTNDMQMGLTHLTALFPFHENLSTLLDQLEAAGVVPIFAGLLPRGDDATAALWVPVYDAVSRGLAEARQIPYFSMYLATRGLAGQGLASDGLHGNVYVTGGGAQPCILDAAGLAFSYNVRNLHSLEQLDAVKRVVLDDAPAPDPAVAPVSGSGTSADPWVIDALPFTHAADTAQSPEDAIDGYPGCATNADESGPERHYQLTVDSPKRVRALLLDRSGVDVDLHLLTGGSGGEACVARDDRALAVELGAGTHRLVVDTFVDATGPMSGRYLLVVLECDPTDIECP